MNINNSINFSSSLDLVNDELARAFIPVMVLIAVYMVIGFLGNPIVAYYYGCVVVSSPSYFFIVVMAIFDIIVCCVSMPLEIVDLRYNYKFPSSAGCKILRFVNYFASTSSGLTLIAIAVDRYRKVCRPFGRPVTMKIARVTTAIICVVAFVISWPSFIIYNIQEVNISSVPGLTGYDCTTIRNANYKFYITVYNGICFLVFIGCLTTLVVLYILVGCKLRQLKKFRFTSITRKNTKAIGSPPTSSCELDSHLNTYDHGTGQTDNKVLSHRQIHEGEQNKNISEEPNCQNNNYNHSVTSVNVYAVSLGNINDIEMSNNETSKQVTTQHDMGRIKTTNSNNETLTIQSHEHSTIDNHTRHETNTLKKQKKIKDRYIHLRKYTFLMFSITIAFVLSFLPYLGLMTWRTLAAKYERELMSKTELVFYNIFIRSWLLSSVVNPLIYGFFNSDFSQFIISRFRKCICKKHLRHDNQSKPDSLHT